MSEYIEICKPDFKFADYRGNLVQLVHSGFSQINVAESNAGAVRGNHCHSENREAFYIIRGSLDVTLWSEKNAVKEKYSFSEGDMFIINRNIYHLFNYKSDTIMVVMYDGGIIRSDGSKDIIPAD